MHTLTPALSRTQNKFICHFSRAREGDYSIRSVNIKRCLARPLSRQLSFTRAGVYCAGEGWGEGVIIDIKERN